MCTFRRKCSFNLANYCTPRGAQLRWISNSVGVYVTEVSIGLPSPMHLCVSQSTPALPPIWHILVSRILKSWADTSNSASHPFLPHTAIYRSNTFTGLRGSPVRSDILTTAGTLECLNDLNVKQRDWPSFAHLTSYTLRWCDPAVTQYSDGRRNL